ncbi:MAG: hypothetical protein ACU0CA_07005 [Paracoccaceae bacterium]
MIDDPDWVAEGLATTVEYEWLGGKANPKVREPKYNTPLAKPDDPYQRGHFFFEMGDSFGDDMAYAGEIVQKPATGDGVAWLDGYLETRGSSLATYFPEFIAKKTDSSFSYPSFSCNKIWKSPCRPAATTHEMRLSNRSRRAKMS